MRTATSVLRQTQTSIWSVDNSEPYQFLHSRRSYWIADPADKSSTTLYEDSLVHGSQPGGKLLKLGNGAF